MLHLLKYSFLSKIRNFNIVFWPLVFPLVLGTFFYFAFGNINEAVFQTVPVAVVKEDTADTFFLTYLEQVGESNPDLLKQEEMSEKEALEALQDKKVEGIYYVGKEPSLTVAGTGIEESILQTVLDSCENTRTTITNIMKKNPQMDMETMKSGQQTLSKTGCYGIDFDNVTFNYTQGGKDALSDVDIHLEPGSLNAFVGPSGAGKTTAVQLLGRYWDVSSGTIKIGGVAVTELQTENLSDLTAFVFQDVFLLEDTLLENIRMGTDATEEQVRQAAKAAQIDDFIMSLPKGYATRIGDEGVKLSGGQQQRISIARAILKDAPIVVFDEATSYSDIENEHKIQLALQNLLRGKTTIMIAHRLHTIRNADKIFVFQDGKVVEQGTHDELIASGSTYSHMWDTYTRETIGEE